LLKQEAMGANSNTKRTILLLKKYEVAP